jgi:hypothetical protein
MANALHRKRVERLHPVAVLLQDKKVRVYSKNRDKTFCAALKYAFEQWANAKLKTQPPGTPWRQTCSQQQQQFALQEAAAYGSSGRVSWGANCFGSGPGLPPRGIAAAENGAAAGGADGIAAGVEHDGIAMVLQMGSQPEQQTLQVPSRKRSLTQDMQSASQQQRSSQQQQQLGSQGGSGGGRSSSGFGSQLEYDAAADAAAAVDGRPAKQSKSGSGGRGSSSSRGAAGLPGIAEDAAEGK